MDTIYKRIAENTTKFNLGDEETWRELYEPMYGPQPEDVNITRDLRYGPAERNTLDVFASKTDSSSGKPVLLFMHGGGFFSGDKEWSEKCWANIGNHFAQHGVVVVIANHRLVHFDRGSNATQPPQTTAVKYPDGANDVQLIREWIYKNISADKFGNGSTYKVVLFGHSSGGAHIAMNLYEAGDPQRSNISPDRLFPPVAGVIYLSVPFWYDRSRPIRQRILQSYYGSDDEETWGPRSALGLFRRLPVESPLLDSSQVPVYIGTVKWEVKEACDAAIDFFNSYRDKSTPAGTLPNFHVLDKHNHLSNVLSIGTRDSAQAERLLEFIRSCTSDTDGATVQGTSLLKTRVKL